MKIYRPARQYTPASLTAASLGTLSAWFGLQWGPAFIPALLFLLSAALLQYLASRPPIQISRRGLRIGAQSFRWDDIVEIRTTSWNSPLVLNLVVRDGRRVRLIYPGDVDSADRLLLEIRGLARRASVDGAPPPAPPVISGAQALLAARRRPRLLRSKDEQDVERLYQQLKAVGRIDGPGAEERD